MMPIYASSTLAPGWVNTAKERSYDKGACRRRRLPRCGKRQKRPLGSSRAVAVDVAIAGTLRGSDGSGGRRQ
jgi:hypothetical protein